MLGGCDVAGDAIQQGLAAGNSQGDWSIGFGACRPSPFYIGAISYLISNQAEPCCTVDGLPSIQFAYTDCAFIEHQLDPTKPLVVNPDESCGCQDGITTATESTTWGKVKSLYR